MKYLTLFSGALLIAWIVPYGATVFSPQILPYTLNFPLSAFSSNGLQYLWNPQPGFGWAVYNETGIGGVNLSTSPCGNQEEEFQLYFTNSSGGIFCIYMPNTEIYVLKNNFTIVAKANFKMPEGSKWVQFSMRNDSLVYVAGNNSEENFDFQQLTFGSIQTQNWFINQITVSNFQGNFEQVMINQMQNWIFSTWQPIQSLMSYYIAQGNGTTILFHQSELLNISKEIDLFSMSYGQLGLAVREIQESSNEFTLQLLNFTNMESYTFGPIVNIKISQRINGEQFYWKINETYFATLNCENCEIENNLTLFMISSNNILIQVSQISFPKKTFFYINNYTESLYAMTTLGTGNIEYYDVIDLPSFSIRYGVSPRQNYPTIWLQNGSLITWSGITVSTFNNPLKGSGFVQPFYNPAIYFNYSGQSAYSLQTEGQCKLMIISLSQSTVSYQGLSSCQCYEQNQVLGDVSLYYNNDNPVYNATIKCSAGIQMLFTFQTRQLCGNQLQISNIETAIFPNYQNYSVNVVQWANWEDGTGPIYLYQCWNNENSEVTQKTLYSKGTAWKFSEQYMVITNQLYNGTKFQIFDGEIGQFLSESVFAEQLFDIVAVYPLDIVYINGKPWIQSYLTVNQENPPNKNYQYFIVQFNGSIEAWQIPLSFSYLLPYSSSIIQIVNSESFYKQNEIQQLNYINNTCTSNNQCETQATLCVDGACVQCVNNEECSALSCYASCAVCMQSSCTCTSCPTPSPSSHTLIMLVIFIGVIVAIVYLLTLKKKIKKNQGELLIGEPEPYQFVSDEDNARMNSKSVMLDKEQAKNFNVYTTQIG